MQQRDANIPSQPPATNVYTAGKLDNVSTPAPSLKNVAISDKDLEQTPPALTTPNQATYSDCTQSKLAVILAAHRQAPALSKMSSHLQLVFKLPELDTLHAHSRLTPSIDKSATRLVYGINQAAAAFKAMCTLYCDQKGC